MYNSLALLTEIIITIYSKQRKQNGKTIDNVNGKNNLQLFCSFFRQEILKIYSEDDVVKEVVISLEKSLALMRCITELTILKHDDFSSSQVRKNIFFFRENILHSPYTVQIDLLSEY